MVKVSPEDDSGGSVRLTAAFEKAWIAVLEVKAMAEKWSRV